MEEPREPNLEELWQFAGRRMSNGDFNTAMVHFYRGEITRSNAWRARLDATTNWAVITTGAALTFAFGAPENTPLILIFNTLLVLLFLLIETRRYRYYELWTSRVRIMERNFIVGLLSPPFVPSSDWADQIAESLNNPRFPIGFAEAFGRRYRRNYMPIFFILAISWMVKIAIHPTDVATMAQFVGRAGFGPINGWFVIGLGVLVHGLLFAVGMLTVGLRATTGEVVSGSSTGVTAVIERIRLAGSEVFETELPRIPRFDTRKQLAYVISDKPEAVGRRVMQETKHGVTLLNGTGMYTGDPHGVLLIAVEARQIKQLKRAVQQVDEKAFVIITPVSEIRGQGYRPLEA